jgi:hypothetical protein
MATTALVTGVLTTTAATVFNGGFASNAASTLTGNLGVTGVTTSGTSSVGTDNTAPSALILRHESDQTSGFDDNFGVGMKFNADASNGGYATHAELQATQKSAGYQLRFKVGGTERLNLDSTGGFVTTPAAAGHAVFNEGGVDADFRVESDGNTHMLFVDAGNNRVGVGTSTPDSPFDVDSSEESSTALVSTFRAGSDNSNNRANVFIGQDDNSRGLLIRAGREIGDRAITQFILNGSGGTIGSNIVNVLEFYESTSSTDFETTFNQDGENVDFRVESDGNANALFVDAGSNLINFGKSNSAPSAAGVTFAGTNLAALTISLSDGNTYHLHDTASYKFYVNANGGIYNFQSNNVNLSDEREKKNIETLESQWDSLKQWSLKKFHYNADDDAESKKYGVIAQDVQAHNPELVTDFMSTEAETRLAVKEQQMMWMAIKALQEAQTRIETLETRLTALENA